MFDLDRLVIYTVITIARRCFRSGEKFPPVIIMITAFERARALKITLARLSGAITAIIAPDIARVTRAIVAIIVPVDAKAHVFNR